MKNSAKYQGYVASVVSLTAALFMLGVVSYAMMGARNSVSSLTGQVTVTVMLADSIGAGQKSQIEERIKRSPEVGSHKFVSKEDAVVEFSSYVGHDVRALLGENPLPSIFSLTVNADFSTTAQLEKLKNNFRSLPGVDNVIYEEEVAERMWATFARLRGIGIGFSAMLVFVAMILIYNTIRLMIGAAGQEIRAMQLVGARRGFICAPFIRRAVVGGALGGMFASGALWFCVKAVAEAMPMLALGFKDLPLIASMEVVVGVALCTIFTYISLNQQLRR